MRCRYEPHGQAHHLRDRPRAGPLREGQREVREAASSRAGAVCGDGWWGPAGGSGRRLDGHRRNGQVVSGKSVVEPDNEAIRFVSGNLNAVSYINLSTGAGNVSVGVPIRLLTIDKVDPEPANVSSGAYPLRRPIVVVTKTPPSPVV